MPGYQDETHSDYSKYDSMTNDELEEILRMDAEKSEDADSDIDMLMYVMGVLAKRRKNSADPGKTPEEAYKSFVEHYCTDDTEVAKDNIHNTIAVTPKRNRSGWKRMLTAAAACFAIFFCGVVTTTALGDDALDQFFDWTKEIFSFSTIEQPEESGPSDEYELLDDTWENVLIWMNIPANLMPNKPLAGFEQIEVSIAEDPQIRSILGQFADGERKLRMTVRHNLTGDPCLTERTEGFQEIYEYNGILYYIFSNTDKTRVVWQVDRYECMIYGDLSMEEIKELIHSIQEG